MRDIPQTIKKHANNRKYFLFGVIFFFLSCNDDPALTYNSITPFFVDNNGNNDLSREQGAFIFYKKKDLRKQNFVCAGFYQDGFRASNWTYNINDDVKNIEWGHFKDDSVGIETNVFNKIDTIVRGDFFTILKYHFKDEKIKLCLAKNSEILRHIDSNNYITVLTRVLDTLGYKVTASNRLVLGKGDKKLNAYLVTGDNLKDNSKLYELTAYVFFDDHNTFDFSVLSNKPNSDYAKILFDGIITNTYSNGERIYSPWGKDSM